MSDFYKDIHARFSKDFSIKFPHYAVPGLNAHCDEDLERVIYSPYKYTKPIPYLPPASVSVEVWAGSDPATDLLRKKLQWRADLDIQKRYYTRAKKEKKLRDTLKTIISSKKKIWDMLPRDAHFVELFASNPDDEFDGIYNWYYTGGCLDTMKINDKHMLLSTHGQKSDELRVIKLKRRKKCWKPSSTVVTQQCTPDIPIYQIRGSCDTGHLCVRQRNDCHLYSLTEELTLQHIHSTECDTAFTGVDVSPHTAGRYATVTSRRLVEEWDASGRRTYRYSTCLDNRLEDRWSCVSYSDDPHGLVLADRNSVYVLDKRNKKSSEKFSPKEETELVGVCEDISLVFPSCLNTHALYICSSHSVLLYDIRNCSKQLQHWTHLLCSPPLLGCTVSPQQNEEIICIANQEPGEVITIVNKWNGEVVKSQSYPQGLPNLRDTLFAANTCGLWLDPAVQHRAKLSLTGLAWLPELTFLSQTSGGDVFVQRQDTENDCKSVTGFTKCLANWEKVLLEGRTSSALNFTCKKSMKNAYEYIKSSRNRLPENKVQYIQPWELSKSQLESYVDLLAPRILEVWEIEDVPEWGESGRNSFRAQLFPEQVDRVEAWLTSIPESRYGKQERRTSHKKTPCKDKHIPLSTSTPYEDKNNQAKRVLDTDLGFSHPERKYSENAEFDLTVRQNKKQKLIPKCEYITGF